MASNSRGFRARGWLACCGLFAACLNPQPDVEPTFRDENPNGQPGPVDIVGPRESCNDNPLLAGCPSGNGSSPPAARPAGSGEMSNPGTSGAGGSDGAAAVDAGAGVGDAGVTPFADTQPADAGAGDAQAL